MAEFECRLCGSHESHVVVAFEDWLAFARTQNDERKLVAGIVAGNEALRFGDVVQCRRCGLRSVERVPSAADLTQFYREYYANRKYSQKADKKIRRASARVRRLQKRVPGGAFLDVGCNLGYAVEAARWAGFTATGIEIDPAAIAEAQRSFPLSEFICTSVEEMAATGRTFDLVYCTEVMEHVPNITSFADALATLTKPGGWLYLTTPDAGHFRVPRDFKRWIEVKPPEHVTWFTKSQLASLFEMRGFDTSFQWNLKPGLKMVAKRRG